MKKTYFKSILAILFSLLLFSIFYIIHIKQAFFGIELIRLESLNEPALLICFSLLFVISNLLLLPLGLPLNLVAGLLWGTLAGGMLINILAAFTATMAFFLARTVGFYFLPGFFDKFTTLQKVKTLINKYDWQCILFARINPIIPSSIANYVFGFIPELSFKNYIVATVIANLIPCLAFASIGAVFKIISVNNTPLHHIILQIGIAISLLSILFIMKMYFGNNKEDVSKNVNSKQLTN